MEEFGEDKDTLKKLLTGRRVQLAEELSECTLSIKSCVQNLKARSPPRMPLRPRLKKTFALILVILCPLTS